MHKKKLALLLMLGSAIALIGLVIAGSRVSSRLSSNQSASKFPVQIQEYMASNTLYPNENGVCADWVELYNSSDAAISIGGFKLTDNNRKSRYTVPAGTVIEGHGYYVIYCLRSGGDGYADFGIARSGGEELLLLNKKNVLVDSVTTIPLSDNESAERDENGQFRVSVQPSPGGAAITEPVPAQSEPTLHAVPGPVTISEVITSNSLYADANGRVTDIVELYNGSDEQVSIGGYVLQDGIEGTQFTVPRGTELPPDAYYLIYCARSQGDGLYADFGLSRNGGELLLLYTADGVLADFLTTVPCTKNGAIVREDGEPTTIAYATPGFANTEQGRQDCLKAYVSGSAVQFSEIMTSNRSVLFADGTAPDWIELVNTAGVEADLSGYGLSDTVTSVRYTFPAETVIPAGGYLVIPCDDTELTGQAAPFSLSAAGGETVYLLKPDGTLYNAAVTAASEDDVSLVYEGGILPVRYSEPTPGFSNDEAGAAAYRALQTEVVTGLLISEVMPNNKCTFAFGDGVFADWVELYNATNEPLSTGAFCLSDRDSDLTRFRLPDVTLAPGEFIVIRCSKEGGKDGEIIAPFGLSSKGGTVYLSSASGMLLDRAVYPAAEPDRSYIRTSDGSFSETDCPTPGFANTGAGYQLFLQSYTAGELYISEAMPANRTVSRNNGKYYDWVELCNGASEPIGLAGYYLTDNTDEPFKCALPDTTLESGAYYLVYCSGDASLTDKSGFHAPFRLNGGEDRLYLYNSAGELVDYLHIYDVPPEGTIGRNGREGGVYLYEKPTPGKENANGTAAIMRTAIPTASLSSGVFENAEPFVISLSGTGTVYYTTDGSKPTTKSSVYTEPIRVSKTSVVRAAALEDDKRMSKPLTLAYTVNEGHTLPVLNLVIAPNDLNGPRGIYSNPREPWQREACIVYTDENGTITHDCGVRISGQTSRSRGQKSFRLIFSDQYGGRLRYDLFGDDCEQSTFPQLLIRAGLDSKYGIFREPFAQKLAMPYRDTTFVQDSVPCVLYINGQYWGIYHFMESLCEETLADRLGVRTDSITLFKGYMYDDSQSKSEIYQLWKYVKTHDMTNPEYYEYIKAHIVFEDLIDWAIFQAYCYNTDLSGNIRYFKSSETDNKWHFVYYDVECVFKDPAGFDNVFKSGQTADFLKSLIRNSEFRDMFLKRFAYHCENSFRQEDVLALFYSYDDAVRAETLRHFPRWDLSSKDYLYNYNQIERLLKADRVKELKRSARIVFGMSDDEYNTYFRG